MKPAWSVILFTTLAGAAQGLVLALVALELRGLATAPLLLGGAGTATALGTAGLVASFFHLGRPERAWRAAAMWRTSWLSREVIVLPVFLAATVAWGALVALGAPAARVAGLVAAAAALALYLCTAMIYASVRFLQEWAHALTPANYLLTGSASGTLLGAALAAVVQPEAVATLTRAALALTVLAGAVRGLSLWRNARLVPRSTLQTAIGIRHPQIRQRAMGFMGGSFNTREFFHGQAPGTLRHVKWGFLLGAFVVPMALVWLGVVAGSPGALALAFVVQYLGLLAERWFFFAQANHPQNLYYQTVS